MKVELEMRGGRWEDHREPFRESFAAVCRSLTQKTFCPPIFGRFPTFADLAGCRISLSGCEPSLPPFSSNKSEIPFSIEIQPSLGCIALYHLKGSPLQKPFTFGQKKTCPKGPFHQVP